MIYGVTRDIAARMKAQKYPHQVVYGVERLSRELQIDNGILVMRDRTQSDRFDSPKGQRRNPNYVAARSLAASAFIYAKSTVAGADVTDHEFEGESAIDMLISALNYTLPKNPWEIRGGRYLQDRELEAIAVPEVFSGVVYWFQFSVDRGVFDKTFAGAARPEGAPTSVSNQTQASLPGGVSSGVACG